MDAGWVILGGSRYNQWVNTQNALNLYRTARAIHYGLHFNRKGGPVSDLQRSLDEEKKLYDRRSGKYKNWKPSTLWYGFKERAWGDQANLPADWYEDQDPNQARRREIARLRKKYKQFQQKLGVYLDHNAPTKRFSKKAITYDKGYIKC